MQTELIIHNANIFTVDPTRPRAEAVACAGGRIVAVGDEAKVMALTGPHTQTIDAEGRLITPGLIDAHVHFLQYALRQQEVNLFGVDDFAEVQKRLRRAVAEAKPGDWVQGWGWMEDPWDVEPHRALLDEIAPDTPLVLRRLDMHTWWVNSAVLRRAGINRETPDPPRSTIERDAAGEPTGLFREWDAIRLIEQHIPEPNSATLEGWLIEAIAEAHQLGLTGIHDQRIEQEGAQTARLFQSLNRQGQLKLRVHMNLAADYVADITNLGLEPGFGDERLWLGHVKAFADGTMGSRTAYMLAPYEGEAQYTGVVVTTADELWELARQAGEAGFSLSVHAIGDRAVREVIDVLAEHQSLGKGLSLPHRIEHVQVIDPADLARLARHHIVASVQPVHIQADWQTADTVWGKRARYAYAFGSMLEQGVRLAFGSDAPVAPLDPMLGIYAAAARQDQAGQPAGGWYPQERLGMADIIRGYTMDPAYMSGQVGRQGSISVGKWADMIAFSQDLFQIEPEAIPATQIDLTIFDGEVVHRRF